MRGANITAARVAWALHNGAWPVGRVYPLDGNPLNLRAENLAERNAVRGDFDHADPVTERFICGSIGGHMTEIGRILISSGSLGSVCTNMEKCLWRKAANAPSVAGRMQVPVTGSQSLLRLTTATKLARFADCSVRLAIRVSEK